MDLPLIALEPEERSIVRHGEPELQLARAVDRRRSARCREH